MKKADIIRILIADDHFVVRMGLASSISLEPDMTIVGEASNGRQAIELHHKLQPDLTLVDLRLPDLAGAEVIGAIRKADSAAKVVAISTSEKSEDMFRAFEAGARAYVCKTAARGELMQTLRAVFQGQWLIPSAIAARLLDRTHAGELTARELEVLHLLAEGRSNKEIGARLAITEPTVKIHLSHIFEKLRAADRTQAVILAVQRGLLHLE